jgi:PKD repeat protein
MFASITGLGAGLRPDDQDAAKWLYPSGSGGGPSVTIPSAPSNLAVTGLGTSLILTWKDNADNETVQTVYLASTPGNFLPVLSVNANQTSAAVQNLQPGKIYYVRVTASNSAGESSASNQAQGSVPGDTLKAAFNASPTSGIANLTAFVFVDKSTGPVSSRQWTFGDGNSSSAANATHVYTQSGNFTVTLRVFDAQGQSSSAQIPVTVKAGPDAIGASFSFAPRNPVSGADVQFTDTSVGPVSQWLWTFGDGGTSTERHPKRRYANAGVYEVKLTVSNGSESSTAQETMTIAAGSGATPLVDADFDLSTLWPAAGRSVSFFDRSSGSPNSWLWTFGDGTESTLRNPTHTYETLGTYTVTLRAGNGPSSSLKEMVIHVNGNTARFQSVLPVASLTSGAGSSFWRTELTISNQTANAANVDLLFLPAAGGTQLRNSVVLGAGESLTWDNALTDLFALAEGSGAVSIESNGSGAAPLLRVSSRTFTTSTNGTYGQYVPALPSAEPATLFIPGLEWNGNFRTNVGLVNHGSQPVSITLSLYDESGRLMGNAPMTLAAQSFQQSSLMGIFPILNGQARNGLALRVQGTTAGAVSAYASVIDNRSQDPILIPAKGVTAREELTVPVVARVPGARGTFWRSDVVIFNPTGTPMTLGLKLTGGTQPERSLTIASGETATIEDVVTWLGEGNAQGPLRINVSGNSYSPLVSTRTYTTREADGGTYGQWIEAFGSEQFRNVTFVTGLRSDSSFRTNVGLVNRSDAPVGATVALINTVGVVTAVPVVVPARGSLQLPAGALFPQVDTSALGVFSVKVESAEPLSSYGSVIDNGSGDPVFIRGD